MKKTASLVLILLMVFLLSASLLAARDRDDLQVIKKAVNENTAYQPGREIKWLKILVRDNRQNKDRVRITLPVSVVELILSCSKERYLPVRCQDYDLDLRELFKELKALGPLSLIEIHEEHESVKIWLE